MSDRAPELANYGVSGALTIGGLALQHWIGLIGLLFIAITFVVDMRDKKMKRRYALEAKRQADELAALDRRIKTAQARRAEAQLEELRRGN